METICSASILSTGILPLLFLGQHIQNGHLNIHLTGKGAGHDMDFTTMYLTLGAILIGLLAYLRYRRKYQNRDVWEPQPSPETEADGETFSDKFYCIMLNDGTVRSGYITDDDSTPTTETTTEQRGT